MQNASICQVQVRILHFRIRGAHKGLVVDTPWSTIAPSIETTCTVANLKRIIESFRGPIFGKKDLILTYSSTILDDDKSMAYYNIHDGSVLIVLNPMMSERDLMQTGLPSMPDGLSELLCEQRRQEFSARLDQGRHQRGALELLLSQTMDRFQSAHAAAQHLLDQYQALRLSSTSRSVVQAASSQYCRAMQEVETLQRELDGLNIDLSTTNKFLVNVEETLRVYC
jgi:hypothetical protein